VSAKQVNRDVVINDAITAEAAAYSMIPELLDGTGEEVVGDRASPHGSGTSGTARRSS